MPFDHIFGQAAAIGTLRRALTSGRVHHAWRFEGPDGVGKEMAAFALAQALVCAAAPPAGATWGEGCGKCSACRRAVTFSTERPLVPVHPDVVVVERGLYPPDVLGQKSGETREISVAQIRRVVLEKTSFAPHEGRARVFIVRRADELSTSAANALLKTLEEPHDRTHFVLITSRGRELLDTIRSRTLLLRFGPLPDDVVRRILEKRGVAPDLAHAAAELAGGSASAALDQADADAVREREEFVEAALAAVAAPDLAAAIALGGGRAPSRDVLSRLLEALAARFASDARALLGSDERLAVVAARRHAVVGQALREVDRNAAIGLLLESMVARLRDVA